MKTLKFASFYNLQVNDVTTLNFIYKFRLSL